jgi:hypothetical protein
MDNNLRNKAMPPPMSRLLRRRTSTTSSSTPARDRRAHGVRPTETDFGVAALFSPWLGFLILLTY